MELVERLKGVAGDLGVDFFGVADLASAHEAILAQGGLVVAEFPRAISIGLRLFDAIVDQLPNRLEERAFAMDYSHHCYTLINQRLDLCASRLSSIVQSAGYRALPVPASQTVDSERLCGLFSHKMAAHLAGLGWIGKSCLLVTPEVGPRVRWATILTDAPLEMTGAPMAQRCGTCRQCVDICPPQAFTGRPFDSQEPREMRFVARKCEQYFDEMAETSDVVVCGLCLYVCPYGRREA